MTTIATVAAAWVLLCACGFFVTRFVLLVRLMAARTGVRFVWSGLPGYLERKYMEADAEVRARLATTFRVQRVLKWLLLISVAVSALALLATAPLRAPGS